MATHAPLTERPIETISDELIERAHRAQMLRANFDSRHAAIVVAAGYSVPLEHVEHVVGAPFGVRDVARPGVS